MEGNFASQKFCLRQCEQCKDPLDLKETYFDNIRFKK